MRGLTVLCEIPPAMIYGLLTRQYTLHGGVIRWSVGTERAGQIVCHLIPSAGMVPDSVFTGLGIVGSVAGIGGVVAGIFSGITVLNTFKILEATKRITELSEMNLAVSLTGFSSLERRLDQLDAKVEEIKSTVAAVLNLLQMTQRAELRVALDHLNNIDMITDQNVRRELLVRSATILGTIGRIYEQRLADAPTLTEAMISEEYYCIAMLAQARCYAELRELAMARRILETAHKDWRRLARGVLVRYLLGEHPERFLARDFATAVPIAVLAEWLDFVYGEVKGLDWIDELRAKGDSWYYYKELDVVAAIRRVARPQEQAEVMRLHTTIIIPAIQKLLARDKVFEAYIAQYTLMEQLEVTAIEFEQLLSTVGPEECIDGFLLLAPKFDNMSGL